ncbi:hypothetical protein RRG08_022125 [Elysia crispata]|uniref:Uncharacterized protein n=1 Tax=Elysia crispata TaxID=231223 RepID=A0AAE0Y026_9GAST|nr:hypothetical protein RRG08_022125 [Elysia crispata]
MSKPSPPPRKTKAKRDARVRPRCKRNTRGFHSSASFDFESKPHTGSTAPQYEVLKHRWKRLETLPSSTKPLKRPVFKQDQRQASKDSNNARKSCPGGGVNPADKQSRKKGPAEGYFKQPHV